MKIIVANPTPISMNMSYYAEFIDNNILYNVEAYRDGTRQLFKHSNTNSRRVRGTRQLNEQLDTLINSQRTVEL